MFIVERKFIKEFLFVFGFKVIECIFRHMSNGKTQNGKRHSAPPTSTKDRFRSPFKTAATPENGTNGNQSDEYETPKKVFKNYSLFIEIFYLIFRKKLLRNVQEQLDHFEMHQEECVFFVQIHHVIVD